MSKDEETEVRLVVGFAAVIAGVILSSTTNYGLTLWGTALGSFVFAVAGMGMTEASQTKDGKMVAGLMTILIFLGVVVYTTTGGK